jgi:hypothetical protein
MSHTTIGTDLHQSFHIHGNLLPEIALDSTLFFDYTANLTHIILGQVLDPSVWIDTRRFKHATGSRRPNPKDVRQTYLNPLCTGKINSCDSCHSGFLLWSSALTLLVLRVGAQHPKHAAASDDLAFSTQFSN